MNQINYIIAFIDTKSQFKTPVLKSSNNSILESPMKDLTKLPNLYGNQNQDPKKRLSVTNNQNPNSIVNKLSLSQNKIIYSNREPSPFDNDMFKEKKQLASNIIAQIAYKSRAGNSPGGARKTNQDSFLSATNILGLEDFSIFAVFDGHGKRINLLLTYL